MDASSLPSLTLIGPGRAGRAFARTWLASGGRVDNVLARTEASARAGAAALGSGRPGALAASSFASAVLVLAVSDDAVSEAARLAAGRGTCGLAFHLSGVLPAEVLAPLRRNATAVGSMHPLRAFTGAPDETLAGAFVAVEGDDAACDAAAGFARLLGAHAHRIPPGAKALYHAGATLAAGGAVALVAAAARAWSLAGIGEENSRSALAALAARAVAAAELHPFDEALTGPIARRDLGTVRSHRDALAGQPELLRLYALLAEETLARTPGRGREEELRAIWAC